MGRSLVGRFALVGTILGGLVPECWGASALSLSSLSFSVLGGIAGVWFGARVASV
jgi:hypothetical protein